MDTLLNKLQLQVKTISFQADDSFFWSPKQQTVHYIDELDKNNNVWSLLHETAHAKLGHTSYESDFELLQLEVAAWEEAKQLSKTVNVTIDEDHIQDCLDTYRDWLHQRSTCPTCGCVSFQSSSNEYRCHNCYTEWHVSNSRFCRPYRLKKYPQKEKSPNDSHRQTTFA